MIRLRWPVLAAVALLTALAASRLDDLQFDTSNESFLVEGDDSLDRMNRFKAIFGNDDSVLVYHEAEDIFQPEPLRRLAAVFDDLMEEIPHLYDGTWIASAEWIEGRDESIEIDPLMDPLPESPAALALARERALSEPSFVGNLVSANGRVAGLFFEMDVYPDDVTDPRKDIPPVVRDIIVRPEHAGLGLVAVGGPLIDYDLDNITVDDGRRLGLYCLAIQIAILLWVGRGLRGVLVPTLVVILGVVWTYGMIALLGFKLGLAAILVPVLLICVGIADSMHLIAEFNEQRRRGRTRNEALTGAMGLVGWPCLLTTLTTAAGFLAFLAADIKPFRQMGIYSALGVGMALVLSFALVPALYSLGFPGRADARPATREDDRWDRVLRGIAKLATTRPAAMIALFIALFVVSAVGYTRVEIETDITHMLGEDVPARIDIDWVDARMGGTSSLEMMLDTREPDGILDPDFLRQAEAVERFVGRHPLTTHTTSLLDVLRKMRKAFHENRPEAYRLPDTRAEAAQYLLLYDTSGGDQRERLVSGDNSVLRLTARSSSLGTTGVRRFIADVEEFVAREIDPSVEVSITGTLDWARSLTDLIARGQRRSFAAALVAITLLMMLVLRSVWLGLISMVPNVFPVLISLGLMGWVGLDMDVMTMTFSALIIGVAVDDTIHFFVRFRREFSRLGAYAPAIEATLRSVGRPIAFTTLTLTLGFSVLSASSVGGVSNFGLLAGFAFTWALLADFLFAPALLMVLRPLGAERV